MAAFEEAATSCQFSSPAAWGYRSADDEISAASSEAPAPSPAVQRLSRRRPALLIAGGRGNERDRRLARSRWPRQDAVSCSRQRCRTWPGGRSAGCPLCTPRRPMPPSTELMSSPRRGRSICAWIHARMCPSPGAMPAHMDLRSTGAIPVLRSNRCSRSREQQRRAERDCVQCSPHVDPPFRFLTFTGLL